MKPHRQIRTSKIVGDPSSKFAYNQNLDEVVNAKHLMMESLESAISEELETFLTNHILYTDGSVVSIEQKFKIIISAARNLKEKYNL